jgi:methyl-accepting chemotaxis protein
VAHSALEQAGSLGEINDAIRQLDQGTQRSAAMVEEATAASHQLSHEADSLLAQVGQFKTTGPARHFGVVRQLAELS